MVIVPGGDVGVTVAVGEALGEVPGEAVGELLGETVGELLKEAVGEYVGVIVAVGVGVSADPQPFTPTRQNKPTHAMTASRGSFPISLSSHLSAGFARNSKSKVAGHNLRAPRRFPNLVDQYLARRPAYSHLPGSGAPSFCS